MTKHSPVFARAHHGAHVFLHRVAIMLLLGASAACGDDAALDSDLDPIDTRDPDLADDAGERDAAPSRPRDEDASHPDGDDDKGSGSADAGRGGATDEPGARDAGRDPAPEPDDNQDDNQQELRSGGCGTNQSGSGNFVARTIQVGDRSRTFHVRVPANYDPRRAYDLVTRWHGSGGDGLSGGLDIQYAAGNDAIVVGADGLDHRWSSRDNDLALFDAILEVVGGEYCVNLKRVFAYGFSAGGGFTNLLSCVRADALRGVASIAGYTSSQANECKGKVAAWYLHDANDDVVSISRWIAARDRLVAANGCSKDTVNVGDGCVAYQGCDAGYPVVWCQTSGLGHTIRGDWAPAKVWSFFSSL